jgi:hypothetical protein
VKFSSTVVPVNTVLACTVVAMVGRRIFGLLTGMTRMSERPQLGMCARSNRIPDIDPGVRDAAARSSPK